MTFIAKFNQHIAVNILLSWLSSEDLLLLISSCCSKVLERCMKDWILQFNDQFDSKLGSIHSIYYLDNFCTLWCDKWNVNLSHSLFLLSNLMPIDKTLSSRVRRLLFLTSDKDNISLDLFCTLTEFRYSGPTGDLLRNCCLGLDLLVFHVSCSNKSIEDSIRIVLTKCKNLIDLRIKRSYTRSMVCAVLVNCRKLQHLIIECPIGQPKQSSMFVLHCKMGLETLGYTGLSFRVAMLYLGSSLKDLRLGAIDGRSMDLGTNLYRQLNALSCMHFQSTSNYIPFESVLHLRKIEISITNTSLMRLTEWCRDVQELSLYRVDTREPLSSNGLKSISKLVLLEHLYIGDCIVSCDVLHSITLGCANLRSLYIGRLDSIESDLSWIYRCTRLTRLNLAPNKLTSDCVTLVVHCCSELKSLTLRHCYLFSGEDLDLVITLRQMLYLEVTGSVSPEIRERVKRFNEMKSSKYLRFLISMDCTDRLLKM